jgi:hypothetical protein
MVLPPSMQSLLPAGWLAFTGRESNPLDRDERFQIIFSSPPSWTYPDATLASLDLACRDHCPDVSATFTTIAFDDSSLRWLGISDLIAEPAE